MSNPFPGVLVQVDAGIAASVVAAVWPPFYRFQDGNRRTIHQFQVIIDNLLLEATTAFGLAGLQ